MVADATRGVKFVIKTELDGNASKPLTQLEQWVSALEKRMAGLKVPVPPAKNGAATYVAQQASHASNGAVDKAAAAREKAAERGFLTEAKWNRMAEAAVEKRAKAEAAAAKKAADADTREAARVTRERQKELDRQAKADKKFWDDAIKQAQDGAKARAEAIVSADKARAAGWKELSAMGRESFVGGRKVAAGFAALSDIGRAAMPRDPFAEGLRNLSEARAASSGWHGLSAIGRDATAKFEATKKRESDERKKAEAEERKSLAERKEAQAKLREGIDATIDSVARLGRGFAQLGLIGESDLHRITDTMLGVQGTIDTVRGSIDSFRSIRGALQTMGALRGGSAGGAAKWAAGLARLGGAAGAGGGGTAAAGGLGLGSIGLAGAGVTALAAGGIGLLGTIADRRRGVPGQTGGAWDTIGGALNAPVGFVNRGLMGLGSRLERSFNEPYGLTQFQSEQRSLDLHKSEFKRDFGAEEGANESYYAAKKRADIAEEETQLLERRTQARLGARQGMRNLRSTIYAEVGSREAEQRQIRREAAEQQYGIRSGNIQARGQNIAGQLGVAFGRQQEFHGELAGLRARQAAGEFVDPAQMARAAAEQAREEGLVTSLTQRQRGNLATAQVENLQRGRQLSEDLGAARQRQAGLGEFDTAEKEGVAREILGIQEEIKKVTEEGVHLAAQRRQLDIDGAQRTLALRERDVAVAKQAAQAMRGQRESAVERFGNLNPMQRRATLEAARMLKQGTELQEPQLDLLRNLPEFFGPQLRERAQRKFKEEGGEELERLSGFQGRMGQAEARERQAIALDVNARNEIAIKLDANTDAMSKALEERIVPIFKSVMQEAINAIEARLHMARGQDFGQGVERANAAGGP